MRQLGFALLVALVIAVLAAPAVAGEPKPRIVNGAPASAGEYPAQGYLQVETSEGTGACGGTLVSARRFLTAAHCAVDGSSVVPPSALLVVLGELTITDAAVDNDELYGVTAVEVHEDYAGNGDERNDVAMLTLDRDAAAGAASDHTPAPIRIVRPSETSLWEPGDVSTIVGWGTISDGGLSSDELLEAQVPLVSDQDCIDAYAVASLPIDPNTMVCAGDDPADPPPYHDTCQGDSGGPLMVLDTVPNPDALIIAGVVSFGISCADPDFPGVYTRIGAPALNAWVRGRLIGVNFSQSPAALTAGQSVNFTGTAEAGSNFTWDFNGDGVFDANGTSVTRAFPAAGNHRVVLRVTDPEGQPAERTKTVNVGAVPAPPPPPPATPAPAAPVSRGPFARLVVATSALVDRRGRFGIRISFAANAPAGRRATVTVLNRGRRLGSARVPVARGRTVRVRVRLTRSGLRRLRRARRLRVTLRLVLGTTVQTRTVLLRLRR